MARDQLGQRGVFGVLAPSTNTIVEPDYYRMGVPGVTAHVGRIHIHNQNLSDNASFESLLAQIRAEIDLACERVLTCEPDYLVMGMSAETFWGGAEGNAEFTARMEARSGLRVATGAEACRRALEIYKPTKLGILTPYQPIADENVRRYFADIGYPVHELIGLRCPSAVSIARVDEDHLRTQLRELVASGVDAIIQVGTNLSMVRLADEAERWLSIPVIAINAATWWMALRENGINDQLQCHGSLLRDH